jgi:hypothetical protein
MEGEIPSPKKIDLKNHQFFFNELWAVIFR